MNYLDQKYINLVSYRLQNFKQKGSQTWNFRCPICNDSEKNKRKSRGYIFYKNNKYVFYCHNCGESQPFYKFLNFIDSNLYQEYILEKLEDKKPPAEKTFDYTVFKKNSSITRSNPLMYMESIESESAEDCLKYVQSRKIPQQFYDKLYYCPLFMTCMNLIKPRTFDTEALKYDEPRLVIPFFNKKNQIHAVQGRSLNKNSSLKYITVILDEKIPKIYGLDHIDDNKIYCVFEGPIDSMYIDNAVATAGGDLTIIANHLYAQNAIIVYDNEPRNPHTINKIYKAIKEGFKVCIWPHSISQKDVSEMICEGFTKKEIIDILKNNCYSGLAAELQLKFWAKCNYWRK